MSAFKSFIFIEIAFLMTVFLPMTSSAPAFIKSFIWALKAIILASRWSLFRPAIGCNHKFCRIVKKKFLFKKYYFSKTVEPQRPKAKNRSQNCCKIDPVCLHIFLLLLLLFLSWLWLLLQPLLLLLHLLLMMFFQLLLLSVVFIIKTIVLDCCCYDDCCCCDCCINSFLFLMP